MDTERIESFKQFAKYLEYPMVVFEAESGKVIDINYEAEVLLGGKINHIYIEPGRTFTKSEFWEILHGKKSLIWHRIRMVADDKEFLVSGLVNEMTEAGKLMYTVLFQCRGDLNIGSLTLERIVEHAGIVAMNMTRTEKGFQVEYVSQNVNQYGYSRRQFYDKVMKVQELICPEDFERFGATLQEAISKRVSEGTIECRILTESRDLIPVRVLLHYIYDDYGNISDFELLIFDLRDEYRKNQESVYLNSAIVKMKSVVLVKAYRTGERTLQYVSPNANMVGMNVEALRKGYKLTEDYIHPEDRDAVMDAIYQAIANGITDYVQVYRMVRDDGKQIWVESEVTVNRISDGEAEISFLITDITEQKEIEKEIAATIEKETIPEPATTNSLSMITVDSGDTDLLTEFQMMADAMCVNANYYSVVLDACGKLLTKPAGPMCDLGQFYDIFERPQFKEEFVNVSNRAKDRRVPQSVSFNIDSLCVHMIFAPLILEDNVVAYWVLTSFAPDGAAFLNDVADVQWKLANSIVKYFYLQDIMSKETKDRRLVEVQLRKEQTEHRVIEDVISSLSREGEVAFSDICYKIGVYLSVENIALYLENKEDGNAEKYFVWGHAEEEPQLYDDMAMSKTEYTALKAEFKESSLLLANHQVENLFLKQIARKTGMSLMIQKLSVSSELEGYVVFADGDGNREFDNSDKHFVNIMAKIFESIVASRQKKVVPDSIRTGLMESYDYIRDAVYVKDNKTGEIIFANKAMDKLFGYSVVGMDTDDVIHDTMEKYRNIGGVRKRFIANKKVSKWQTYVKEINQIMNIVEVHMETLYGADWSVLILKKNKDKKKN